MVCSCCCPPLFRLGSLCSCGRYFLDVSSFSVSTRAKKKYRCKAYSIGEKLRALDADFFLNFFIFKAFRNVNTHKINIKMMERDGNAHSERCLGIN